MLNNLDNDTYGRKLFYDIYDRMYDIETKLQYVLENQDTKKRLIPMYKIELKELANELNKKLHKAIDRFED